MGLCRWRRPIHLYHHLLPHSGSRQLLHLITMSTSQYEAKYGFTAFAERWNGRVAMLGVTIAIVTQLVSGSIW
jgi:hypothetical protein